MWKRLRHRPLQAVVIALLAALITACACFAPLYVRAMQQALTIDTLDSASASERAVTVSSAGENAVSLDGLLREVPTQILAVSGEPITSTRIQVNEIAPTGDALLGSLQAAAGTCRHVVLGPGRCPDAEGEVAISAADARNFGWAPGSKVPVFEVPDVNAGTDVAAPTGLTAVVVGVYAPRAGDDWLAMPLVGRSGTRSAGGASALTDDWIVDPSWVPAQGAPAWARPTDQVTLPLGPGRMGFDELAGLAPEVTAHSARVDRQARLSDIPQEVSSQIPELARSVELGMAPARVTVPLLMVQLAVLAVVVLSLVLAATTEQRRPEVALARLRGQGARWPADSSSASWGRSPPSVCSWAVWSAWRCLCCRPIYSWARSRSRCAPISGWPGARPGSPSSSSSWWRYDA